MVESFDECPLPIASHDINGIFNYLNKAALSLFNVSLEEVIGKPTTMTAPDSEQKERNRLLKQVNSEGFINNYKGIRVTSDPFCREIISKLDGPLVSTSANVSGQPFPKSFHEISADIIRNMDYIVNHRQEDTEEGLPSVLAEFNKKGELFFIRE